MKSYSVKDVRPIIIRDRETKIEIVRSRAVNLAKEIIEELEKQDKIDGIYVENLYEIYNERTGEVI